MTEEAMELIEAIEDMAERVPDEGIDFAESVLEKARSIGETIESTGRVTQRQLDALQNMHDGLEKWMRD